MVGTVNTVAGVVRSLVGGVGNATSSSSLGEVAPPGELPLWAGVLMGACSLLLLGGLTGLVMYLRRRRQATTENTTR